MEYQNIKTFDELLNQKYGQTGTPKREEFQAKAKAFYICEMLKEERKKAKITQSDLAQRADMKKEVISRIENGKIDVQLSTFLRVLEGLGLQLKLVALN
jgi:HTH-type transcriptional regulator / antitoxin HipB